MDTNELFEQFLDERKKAEDPDVKDMPGSQPKGYYKGVDKKDKEARAKHFKKYAKMDDDNPAAYKPAPGDEDVKTKPSKHTKKFKDMFGEASENDCAPKKRYHTLMASNGKVKFDKRFKLYKPKKDVPDNVKEFIKAAKELEESVNLLESKAETALKAKAEKSGMPYAILKKVYDRGVAAWRTGHRPGTNPHQWGLARVNSFATKSKGTWGKADKDLADKVRSEEVNLEEGYRNIMTTQDGETFKSKLFTSKKDSDDHHYKMTKATDKRGKKLYKSIETVKEGLDEKLSTGNVFKKAIAKTLKKKTVNTAIELVKKAIASDKKHGPEYHVANVIRKNNFDINPKVLYNIMFEGLELEEARNYKDSPSGSHSVKATVCYLDPMTRRRKCKDIYFKSKMDALGFKDNVKGFPKGAEVEAIKESGAGDWGTDELTAKYKKDTPNA